jgi:hypothetical protein
VAAHINEYEILRKLSCDEIDRWLRQTYPNGRPAQWWNSIFESVESEVIARIHERETVDRDLFELALHLLRSGIQDSVDAGYAGHWYLRFAALARRARLNVSDLPSDLTPDGAARLAISFIPLTREHAVTLAQRRNVAFARDELGDVSDEELRALQDCELIIPTLEWIREFITDRWLRDEIAEWFRAHDRMAPNAS